MQKQKYTVYRNDIKFKKYREIDPECANWTDDVKSAFHGCDTDCIEYRIEECVREKYEVIDLSHMSSECFEEFISHSQFKLIVNKLHHIFAQSSNLSIIPNLHKFTNLITLDLSNNSLTKIHNLPESLEELILDNNKLTSLTHSMPNLKRLKIINNNISEIKLSNSIESAYLNNNPIISISSIDNIKYLNISNTNIKHIHSYPKLEIFECQYTKIKSIPRMDKLKELICNYSDVSDISELKYLESIEMINTQISKIHHMNSLYSLKYHGDNKFRLSNLYQLFNIMKNKKNINEILFKLSNIDGDKIELNDEPRKI